MSKKKDNSYQSVLLEVEGPQKLINRVARGRLRRLFSGAASLGIRKVLLAYASDVPGISLCGGVTACCHREWALRVAGPHHARYRNVLARGQDHTV